MGKRSTQISLFDGNDSYREIKKHSSMVQMTNVTTLQERKVMNSLIWIAKDMLKRQPDSGSFNCDLWILKRLSGLNDTNNEELKDALRNLVDTKVEYNIFNKDKKERGVFSVLAEAKLQEQGRWKPTFVSFEFPSTVLEVVKNPNMYVRLDLLIIRDLKSKHSIALYEFLKDYQNIGRFRCGIEEFRKLMGIQPGQYEIFTMLRKRVLEKAVHEINEKTDLMVNYDLELAGRKTTAILFEMQGNDMPFQEEEAHQAIREKLGGFGLKEEKIEELLENHDEQYLWANIGIVEEQVKKGKVSNVVAYLLKAFQDDYRQAETEFEKQQEEKEKAKIELRVKAAVEEQKANDKKEELRKQYDAELNKQIEQLLSSLSEEEISSLKEQFTNAKGSNLLVKKLIESKWFDNPLILHQRKRFLAEQFLPDEYAGFEAFLEGKT